MSNNSDLYAQLIALSRQTFDRRAYATAYYALLAAMHIAVDAADVAGLREVSAEAAAQLSVIDDAAPEHRMSSLATEGMHGRFNPYTALSRLAASHVAIARRRPQPPSVDEVIDVQPARHLSPFPKQAALDFMVSGNIH